MEYLNLNALELEEMNEMEQSETNGGVWWLVIVGGILVDAMINSERYSEAMVEGWNDARNNK